MPWMSRSRDLPMDSVCAPTDACPWSKRPRLTTSWKAAMSTSASSSRLNSASGK